MAEFTSKALSLKESPLSLCLAVQLKVSPKAAGATTGGDQPILSPPHLAHVRALPSCRKRDLEEAAEPNSQENSWLVSVEAEASPQRLCSVFLGLPVTHCVAVHHSSVHSRPHTCVGASVSSALYTVNELHHITKL